MKKKKYKFNIIDCINYVYIQQYDGKYSGATIYGMLFDGKQPKETSKSGWYKLDKIPTKLEIKNSSIKKNKRYELKEGYSPSDLMPMVILYDDYDDDKYENISGCYKYLYDEVDGGTSIVEFEINKIYTREDFDFVKNEYGAQSSLLTQIEYPSELYQEFPCKLNRSQMMEILRTHVKNNIDRKYAEITSDYKFHFEVKKKISLSNPYNIMVDSNNSFSNRRRKPKWVERIISQKSETILSLTDGSSSNSYDAELTPEIVGKNYEDLKENLNKYLNDIMEMINVPYFEFPITITCPFSSSNSYNFDLVGSMRFVLVRKCESGIP